MDDTDGDLPLGDADRRRLRDEVASLYPDSRAATRLLADVGVERGRQPLWEGAGNPVGWWAEAFAAFDRGVAESPYGRLLRTALAEYPANGVLRDIARRHGVGVPSGSETAAGGDPQPLAAQAGSQPGELGGGAPDPVGDAEEAAAGAAREAPRASTKPVVWGVPWPRNPNFTGRAAELLLLGRRLAGDGAAAVLPQALHGLGGVGKSQLAVEYTYRHRADYDVVWWVPGDQPAGVVASLDELARRLGVAVAGQADLSAAAAVDLLRRREPYGRWLVVVDNAVGPSDLHGLLSAAGGGGHVLVTSRDSAWSGVTEAVEVGVLPRGDAVRLLRRRAERLAEADAERVAEVLGDLPLALEQAGAWLARTPVTAAEYLDLVGSRTREILAEGKPETYPVPAAATWTVAVEKIGDRAAEALLRLWAFFGPEPIPADVLDVGVVPAPLVALAADPLAYGRAGGRVAGLGLVRMTADGVVMHRLVQAVLRDHTAAADRAGWRRVVHRLLAAADPAEPGNPAAWPRYALLHSHAVSTGLLEAVGEDGRRLVVHLAEYLRARGDYSNSLDFTRRVHTQWAQALGEDHPDTVSAAAGLAGALWLAGRHRDARTMIEDVVERRRRVLGEDHPDTLGAVSNLATVLRSQGDFPAARELEQDVVARRRRLFGADHPDTLAAEGNLAATLRAMGDPAARAVAEDVVTRSGRVLGEDHPDTVKAASSLAAVLWSLGDYKAARSLAEDVLTRRRRLLGDDHPETITAAANLAATARSMGDVAFSRALFEDVVARRTRILGERHPNTIAAQRALAQVRIEPPSTTAEE